MVGMCGLPHADRVNTARPEVADVCSVVGGDPVLMEMIEMSRLKTIRLLIMNARILTLTRWMIQNVVTETNAIWEGSTKITVF